MSKYCRTDGATSAVFFTARSCAKSYAAEDCPSARTKACGDLQEVETTEADRRWTARELANGAHNPLRPVEHRVVTSG